MGKRRGRAANGAGAEPDHDDEDEEVVEPVADALGLLVAPAAPGAFLEGWWEQKPRLLRATAARKALAERTLRARAYLEALEAGGALHGMDVCCVRHAEATGRETLAQEAAERMDAVTAKGLEKLFTREGATLQVHQPQRFVGALWALCAGLEAQLGALVGANTYITPPGKQGLAPHYDDVEIFVIHTQGRKRWRVYAPLDERHKLPREVSEDLDRASLGPPVLEETLEPGDVLYLPRGTPHEATALPGEDSVHVTVSTYQRWTVGDLAAAVASSVMEQPAQSAAAPPLASRRGLPFRAALPGDGALVGCRPLVASALRQLADEVERGGACLNAGMDALSADFMRSRLPPPPMAGSAGEPPTLQSRVRAALPGYARVDGVGLGTSVRVVSCAENDRLAHMMPPADDSDSEGAGSDEGSVEDDEEEGDELDELLWFPQEYAAALERLLACEAAEGVAVRDLDELPDDDDERLAVVHALWSAGLVATVAPGAKHSRPAKKAKAN